MILEVLVMTKNGPVREFITISYNKGDMLVFTGTLIHGGGEYYEVCNMRLHYYYDCSHPNNHGRKRVPGQNYWADINVFDRGTTHLDSIRQSGLKGVEASAQKRMKRKATKATRVLNFKCF